MATLVKSRSGTWKAVIRKVGWPTATKTFRTKRDAEDWARRTEDEMVRGVYIRRAGSERTTVEIALQRYVSEVTPTKRPVTQVSERRRAAVIAARLGKYSLAALTPDIVARFRDDRLAGDPGPDGKFKPRGNNTVRLELALLGHLFTIAIKEWGLGLTLNPVAAIRRPSRDLAANQNSVQHNLAFPISVFMQLAVAMEGDSRRSGVRGGIHPPYHARARLAADALKRWIDANRGHAEAHALQVLWEEADQLVNDVERTGVDEYFAALDREAAKVSLESLKVH